LVKRVVIPVISVVWITDGRKKRGNKSNLLEAISEAEALLLRVKVSILYMEP